MNGLTQTGTTPSPLRLLLVDDSAVMRGLLSRVLDASDGMTVVATANDGVMALQELGRQPIDVVLLDVNMPRMNGLETIPEILRASPQTKILVVSTFEGEEANTAIQALQMGANDVIAKPVATRDKLETEKFYAELVSKIRALTKQKYAAGFNGAAKSVAADCPKVLYKISDKNIYPMNKPRALAIASSTGGPQALAQVFGQLKGRLAGVPIYITQHMPPNFTGVLAKNLSDVGGRKVHEGAEGMVVMAGETYIAPGNFHMLPKQEGINVVLHLDNGPQVNYCRPAADPMIEALVDVYGSGLLLVVLTGMGQDGLNGAQRLVSRGGSVIAQDKDTSVVWGMPKAVSENNLCKAELPLNSIAPYIVRAFREESL